MVLVANKCDLAEKNRKVTQAEIDAVRLEWYAFDCSLFILFFSFILEIFSCVFSTFLFCSHLFMHSFTLTCLFVFSWLGIDRR
jgi:hypothetical protein